MHNLLLLLILMSPNILQTISYNDLRFQVVRSNGTAYSIEYLPNDEDLKFPKTEEDLQQAKKMWTDYYTCIVKKHYGKSRPEIRRLVEGQFTEFICDICRKPFQNYDEIEWKYKPLSSNNFSQFESLYLTPEMVLTNEKHLKMYNIKEEFAGFYVCYDGRDLVSVFILEVSKNDPIQEVNKYYANSHVWSNLQIPDLRIYRLWSEWTECSSCEIVGKRFMYGSCMVTMRNIEDTIIFDQNRKRRRPKRNIIKRLVSNAKEYFNNLLHGTKSKTNNTIMPGPSDFDVARRVISAFQNGVPCMSPILPKFVFESIDENNKAVQAIVEYCLVPCQEIEIFRVIDSSGKVIETANNSAGIYSLYQKIPRLPPEVERRTLVAEFGKDIIIQCPGTILKNIPVTWKINKKIIFPELIANDSDGRFTIDPINRIHLKKLRLKDNHIYSCWQRNRLVGTVHLYVEKKFTLSLGHHVMLCLAVATAGILIFIETKVCMRELESNKK